MKDNDDQTLENLEVKTPSPLSSPADRSSNDEEEDPVRSESSSGGSSPSELKKRLRDLPSPSEVTRFASRVAAISRRLSRKRDGYFRFHGATNRIEEKEEKEEKEQEQQISLKQKSLNKVQATDARARRRAKIRSETIQIKNQTMVVSQSSAPGTSEIKDQSKNERKSSRSSITDDESLERDSKCLRLSMIETSKSYSPQCSPLSRKPPTILSPYRNQRLDDKDDPAQLQGNASVLHTTLSTEISPKDRIELQPLSPLSWRNIRPTKFGGYRPLPGVILHNLSSGSEAESSNEVLSSRIHSVRRIESPAGVASSINFSEMVGTPPVLSGRSNIRNSCDRLSSTTVSSSRRSSNPENPASQRVVETPISVKSQEKDLETLMRIDSKCFVDCNSSRDTKLPLSTGTILEDAGDFVSTFSEFKTIKSEDHNVAITFKEFSDEELEEGDNKEGNIFPKGEILKPIEEHQELSLNCDHRDVSNTYNDIKNVPALALHSQELSHSTSAGSKSCSGKQLDVDALIAALSNVSLKHKTPNEFSATNCPESYEGSKTTSRPGSSENSLTIDRSSRTSDKRPARNETPKRSRRSSFSVRSKIPLKIPESRRSSQKANNFPEPEETFDPPIGEFVSAATSINSNRKMLQNISPFSEESHVNSERGQFLRSHNSREILSSNRKTARNLTESISPISGSSTRLNSKEQTKRSESESSYERTRFVPKYDRYENNQEVQNLTFRADSSRSKKSDECETCENSMRGSLEQRRSKQTLLENLNSSKSQVHRDANEVDSSRTLNSSVFQKRNHEVHSRAMQSEFENTVNYESYDKIDSLRSENETNASSFVSRINDIFCYDNDAQEKFIPRVGSADSVKTVHSKQPDSYRSKYYEGETCARMSSEKYSQIENQIGDSTRRNIFMEDLSPETGEKFQLQELPLNSSPEIQEMTKKRKLNENQEKVRFSMERLAAEQFRRNICVEHSKTVQSESAPFLAEKTHDSSMFPIKCSSSTSKLRRGSDRTRDSPRFKKKSQDRFPFTISEKTSAASMKYKTTADRGRQSLDENSKSLERTYKLDVHPSITRLAGSGFQDTPTEIMNYVAYSEQEERRIRMSGMKGFVRRFSARLRRSRKRCNETKPDAETTSVIYENRAYLVDSIGNSCSESSLVKEFKSCDNLFKNRCIVRNDPDERSSGMSDEKFPKRKSPKGVESPECPRRRYDRDDLWVQEFKDPGSSREEETGVQETEKNLVDSKSLPKDPCSLFFVKTESQTSNTCEEQIGSRDELNDDDSVERKRNRVKFDGGSLPVALKRSKGSVDRNDEIREDEDLGNGSTVETGCLCWRFYRMIARLSVGSTSRYQSPVKRGDSSSRIKRRPRFSLRKRKG